MKATPRIICLLSAVILLLGCNIVYPDATPEPLSPAVLTASPANSETEIKDAELAASRLIEACQENDHITAKNLHTPQRQKRQENMVLPILWCGMGNNATQITLSDQYTYGQAIYFLYTYNHQDTGNSTGEKGAYCLEMMRSEDGKWLANRYLNPMVTDDGGDYLEKCLSTFLSAK